MHNGFKDIAVLTTMEDLQKFCYGSNKAARLIIIPSILLIGAGVIFALDKIKTLEKKYENLEEDYHNYVIEHSEYKPDLDDDDWPDIDEF